MVLYRLSRKIGRVPAGTLVFRTEPLPANYKGTATVYLVITGKRLDVPASRLQFVDQANHPDVSSAA
jgi:hypothetical protein